MSSVEPSSTSGPDVLAAVKRDADRFVRRLGLPAEQQHLYDDIVQDTLIVADRKLASLVRFDPPALSSWTYATVFLVTRGSKRAEVRRTAAWARVRDAFINDEVRAVFDRDGEANADLLAGALSVLTERDRRLLTGQVWDGQSTTELAASTGLSEANVRQRLSRARKLARESGLRAKNL
jgi:RNA polymerase sigma factor (sigma-70 family)